MINRTPMSGVQSRAADRQSGRAGGENVGSVQYGRNPQTGTNWNAARQSMPCRTQEEPPMHTGMPHPVPMAQASEIAESEEMMEHEYCEARVAHQPSAERALTRREAQSCRIEPPEREECELLPESLRNPLYMPGYLRTQIGKTVQAEFILGTDMTADRIGTLIDVGANYIILQALDSQNLLLCDIHSIKFVTVVEDQY